SRTRSIPAYIASSPSGAGVIVKGSARSAPLVGGLRRGATRLRSSRRSSFHPGSARSAPLVGGLRRGATRPRSPRRSSFHAGSARPGHFVGDLTKARPGSVTRAPSRQGAAGDEARPGSGPLLVLHSTPFIARKARRSEEH